MNFELPQNFKDSANVESQFSFNDLFKGNATQLLQDFMKKLEVSEVKIEATEAEVSGIAE